MNFIHLNRGIAKGKPEKNQDFRDSNPDLGDTGGALQPIELTSQLEAGHYTAA